MHFLGAIHTLSDRKAYILRAIQLAKEMFRNWLEHKELSTMAGILYRLLT